jgi:TRAP-type C4-dicarboxylate transport system permease small subunit
MKILRLLDRYFEETACSVLLVILVGLLGWQVFTRFILNYSSSWNEEISRYTFIWMVYLGVSLGVKRREHIRIMIFLKLIPKKLHRGIYYLAEIGWLGFCLVVFILSIDMVKTMFTFKHLSAALQWNMAYIYLIIPFSMLLTGFRIVQCLYQDWKGGCAAAGEGA